MTDKKIIKLHNILLSAILSFSLTACTTDEIQDSSQKPEEDVRQSFDMSSLDTSTFDSSLADIASEDSGTQLEDMELDMNKVDDGNSIDMKTIYQFIPLDFSDACGEEEGVYQSKRDYEELRGCTKVRGSVICPFCDQADLFVNLSAMEAVEVDFSITTNSTPNPLNGIDSLAYVGRKMTLLRLSEVKEIDRLETLEVVGGELRVNDLPLIESLSGLRNLRYAGSLTLRGLEQLKSLDGLENLERIEGDLIIEKFDSLDESSIQRLTDRVSIGGNITIE